jgi:uncharacterized protein
MFSNLSDLKKAGLFYGLAMTLSLIVILLFRAVAPQARIVIWANMMTPLLATVIMLFVVTRDGYTRNGRSSLGLGCSGWRTWALALLLPIPILAVTYGLGWLSGAAPLATPTNNGGLSSLLRNFLPGPGLLIGILLALGEEIGFRGYLLPRLLELGRKQALILSGFLHATWHLPLIFLTPFYLTEGNRLLTIPVFLLLLTAGGTIYGALRLATDSLWPSTILHASFNAYLDVFTALTVMSSPMAIYLVGEGGVLTMLVTAVVALWFIQRWQMPVTRIPALETS